VRWRKENEFLRGPLVGAIVLGLAAAALGLRGFGFASIAVCFLIFIPIVYGNSIFGLLTSPASRLLGMISYSIYMCHGFVLAAAHTALEHTIGMSRL